MKNKTLTKNMPNVKWKSIPPVKGPDSQGISAPLKPLNMLTNLKTLYAMINKFFIPTLVLYYLLC